jgi:hypothetical protein
VSDAFFFDMTGAYIEFQSDDGEAVLRGIVTGDERREDGIPVLDVQWEWAPDPCGGNVKGGGGCCCDPPFGKDEQ